MLPKSDDTLGKRLCYESNFSIECLRKQAGNRTETALTDQSETMSGTIRAHQGNGSVRISLLPRVLPLPSVTGHLIA
jgi:hypothetical protein